MLQVHHYPKLPDFKKTVLTMGMFDGVHIAHKSILQEMVMLAKSKGLSSIVLTFNIHPRSIIKPSDESKKYMLNTLSEKSALIAEMGVDHLIVLPFNKYWANITAEQFIDEILKEKCNVSNLFMGYDHGFGKDRKGDKNMIQQYWQECEITLIPKQTIDEEAISSSRIRKAIIEGNIALANSLLGKEYTLEGKVIEGKKLGRTIQFPTANIRVSNNKILPKIGVYAVQLFHRNKGYFGMANLGFNPTTGENIFSFEVHLFHADVSIYHQKVQVKFHKFIRDEIKFDNIELLKKQLQKDEQEVKQYFNC